MKIRIDLNEYCASDNNIKESATIELAANTPMEGLHQSRCLIVSMMLSEKTEELRTISLSRIEADGQPVSMNIPADFMQSINAEVAQIRQRELESATTIAPA